MSYETRAYDNEYGDPVVVLVATGTHDVSRLVNLLAGSRMALCEHMTMSQRLLRQVKRHNGGRAALELLAAHGGPDLTNAPAKYTATGSGTTTTDATGQVVLNIDTADGPVHIDLGTEFAEPMGRAPARRPRAQRWRVLLRRRHGWCRMSAITPPTPENVAEMLTSGDNDYHDGNDWKPGLSAAGNIVQISITPYDEDGNDLDDVHFRAVVVEGETTPIVLPPGAKPAYVNGDDGYKWLTCEGCGQPLMEVDAGVGLSEMNAKHAAHKCAEAAQADQTGGAK